ncbi:MAG: WecB/TagA/CpsF family glycosyltransferase [Planctomycetota bacterium]
MINKGEFNLLGINISAVDYEAAVSKIVDAAKSDRPFGVSALAVHGVMTGVMDDSHRHRLNDLEMLVPDGQPVRWALNLAHRTKLRDRVYGPNLMLKTCRAAEEQGIPIFLFGGKQELLDSLTERLLERFPDLKIAGRCPSKFRTLTLAEKQETIRMIRESGAKITFVGLGCPRQEVWTYEFKEHLKMPVLAVGAAFNFHAGRLSQAPPFLQNLGLEWLYRLTREPTRLWKRYLLLNPYYVGLFLLQWLRLRKFRTDSTVAPDGEILYG